MDLSIDMARNSIVVDGKPVAGHHRWEAAALAVLVQGGHVGADCACTAHELHATLSTLGQSHPLNRKQLSRVWSGLDQMFVQAGYPGALTSRLRHAMRGRTVGPWWWAAHAGDKVRVVKAPTLRTARHELPRLAQDESLTSSAKLCLQILLHQGAVDDGRISEALVTLEEAEPWRQASPELLVYRSLRLAELHIQQRSFDKARGALVTCRTLVKRNPVAAVYMGSSLQLMRYRVLYASSPIRNAATISAALGPWINQAPTARSPEADRFTRGLTLNLAALCERRWLEQHHNPEHEERWKPHYDAALRYWFAALYGFLTSNQYEYVQYMCSNIGYFLQRMFERGVVSTPDEALEWYGLAQAWQNRFNLPENNVWEYIFLGDFWLYVPHVRQAFLGRAAVGQWAGRRPDTLEFYEFAVKRALEIGEPRQLAHTLLNLWHFSKLQGLVSLARRVKSDLRKHLTEHSDVRSILRAEGYSLP